MADLTDTGEDSKLVHRRKRPKVDTLFSSLFFRRVRAMSMTFSPVSVKRCTGSWRTQILNSTKKFQLCKKFQLREVPVVGNSSWGEDSKNLPLERTIFFQFCRWEIKIFPSIKSSNSSVLDSEKNVSRTLNSPDDASLRLCFLLFLHY